MLVDKVKAVRGTYRVPERFFLILALLGGGFGVVVGMLVFRHKIRKPLFTVWIPLVGALVYGLGYYGFNRFL